MKATALIAGIGNIFLGDDAFGCFVARRLAERSYPAGVRIIDFGIRGFDLAFALMEKYDLVILLDAFPHDAAPGSLRVLDIPVQHSERDLSGLPETHGVAPTRALKLAQYLGIGTQKVYLVGCQPHTLEPDQDGKLGLSAPVARSVDTAIGLVEGLLAPLFPPLRSDPNPLARPEVCTN